MNQIILIAGATASGKSTFAKNIAKKLGGEIINADSMQVYKDLKILTARPDHNEDNIPHHMYGFLDGKEYWSLGEWIKEASEITESILKKDKIPIFVGGTGLYFKSLTDGISSIPNVDKSVRTTLNQEYQKYGLSQLKKELDRVDPLIASKINSNDKQRILRALEIYRGTKKKMSDFWNEKRIKYINNPLIKIILKSSRETLYKNCDIRFDKMIKKGAIEEVELLIKKKLPKNTPIMKAIGVKEISSYLEKTITLDEAGNLIKFRTHQYAKRQLTWARNQMITWEEVSTQDSDSFIDKIIKKL